MLQDNASVLDYLFDAPRVRLIGSPDDQGILGRGKRESVPLCGGPARIYRPLYERIDTDTGPRWSLIRWVPEDQLMPLVPGAGS